MQHTRTHSTRTHCTHAGFPAVLFDACVGGRCGELSVAPQLSVGRRGGYRGGGGRGNMMTVCATVAQGAARVQHGIQYPLGAVGEKQLLHVDNGGAKHALIRGTASTGHARWCRSALGQLPFYIQLYVCTVARAKDPGSGTTNGKASWPCAAFSHTWSPASIWIHALCHRTARLCV